MERVSTLIRWALGELPVPRPPEDGSGSRVVFTVVVCTLMMLVGQGHSFDADPLPFAAWRLLVHGGVPFAWFAAWEAFSRRQRRALAVAGALPATALVLARVLFPTETGFLQSQPVWMLAVTAFAVVATWTSLEADAWGLGVGAWRWWGPRTLMALGVMVPVLVAVVWMSPPLREFYPTWAPARTSAAAFVLGHLAIALDFLGWEFLFRGLLLQVLMRRGDAVTAICLQAIPFCLLHANKPVVELVSSLLGGLLAGRFCVSARSFLPLWLLHTAMMTTVGAAAALLRAN